MWVFSALQLPPCRCICMVANGPATCGCRAKTKIKGNTGLQVLLRSNEHHIATKTKEVHDTWSWAGSAAARLWEPSPFFEAGKDGKPRLLLRLGQHSVLRNLYTGLKGFTGPHSDVAGDVSVRICMSWRCLVASHKMAHQHSNIILVM